ncbi:hypothetical protein AMAG_12542 [Allomyces macrogynus ATCC 38327]|uniref:FAM192A/Fyv6 N-terminal domain-containing protein n=1 Tax=Allomyces macrogynus (strain ATCC 38327) TaxID=578462 RepID=A0A0L0SZI9_ALLM3|nr:hypothetical protein AMAG_12542 [Allomyces macrogynus ATCC 38327]|eukprot:KNE67825.1 hypothetical protein AMAG_12542 [Allomyces macrogynus ATCC 38327]
MIAATISSPSSSIIIISRAHLHTLRLAADRPPATRTAAATVSSDQQPRPPRPPTMQAERDPFGRPLGGPVLGKAFVSESELEAARREREEAYRRAGKSPPPEDDGDTRPLAERLAEQKRKKDEEYEEQMRLANQVHVLDDDEVEFLHDVQAAARFAEDEIRFQEQRELARFHALRDAAAASADPAGPARAVVDPNVLLNEARAIMPGGKVAEKPEVVLVVPPPPKRAVKADVQRAILAAGIIVPGRKRKATSGSESTDATDADAVPEPDTKKARADELPRSRTASESAPSESQPALVPPRPPAKPKVLLAQYDSDEDDDD